MRARELAAPLPRWDCHVHTRYTDGEVDVDVAVQHAVARGLDGMVFTEHTEPWQARYAGWFPHYLADIRAAQARYAGQIEIVIGLEAPAIDFDGGLELTDEMAGSVDFILGAAHRYPGMGDVRLADLDPQVAIDLEFRTLMALAVNPRVHAIAHLGATCAKYCGPFPEALTREVIGTATAHGIPIEINPAYHQPLPAFIQLCRDADALVIFGSNAHTLAQVGTAHSAIERAIA